MSAATIAVAAALITVAAVVFTSWINGRQVRQTSAHLMSRTELLAESQNDKLEVIRRDVNSNLTAALDRIKILEDALGIEEGGEVPTKEEAL